MDRKRGTTPTVIAVTICYTHGKVKKEEIYLYDLKRILIGNAPPEFLLEVLIRTLLIYLAVLVVVRLLGKRMSGQVTLVEMALLIMLGAIIGSPIQIPDRGIVTALIVLISVLLIQRAVNVMSYKSQRFEQVTQGNSSMLVKNGVLQLDQMQQERVSTQQLFALLREQQIRQLGEVKRVYLEACGIFSVYKASQPRPGLSVYPTDDARLFHELSASDPGQVVCGHCGYTPSHAADVCPVCGNKAFQKAIA